MTKTKVAPFYLGHGVYPGLYLHTRCLTLGKSVNWRFLRLTLQLYHSVVWLSLHGFDENIMIITN